MKFSGVTLTCLLGVLVILAPEIDAKRKKNKSSSQPKSKTKTKWSTSMDFPEGASPLLATEEHGYYVKRTFLAPDGTVRTNISDNGGSLKTVPYLAIPIAWFPCAEGQACRSGYSAIFNTGLNAMSEGFLCDDDCTEPYEPICGRTPNEIAVFYNKCKLNVAKCRTHGYWTDYSMEECQKAYPKELEYTDKKFRNSPYFKSMESTNTDPEGNTNETMLIGLDPVIAATKTEKTPDKVEGNEKNLRLEEAKPDINYYKIK